MPNSNIKDFILQNKGRCLLKEHQEKKKIFLVEKKANIAKSPRVIYKKSRLVEVFLDNFFHGAVGIPFFDKTVDEGGEGGTFSGNHCKMLYAKFFLK